MSDRVFVMCEGSHTGTISIENADQHTIMKYATSSVEAAEAVEAGNQRKADTDD